MWFKDNYIPDRTAAYEFLHSLGMDDFDIQDFTTLLLQDDEDSVDWEQEAEEWKKDAIAQAEERNNLITELQDIVDDLLQGKSTKKNLAAKMSYLCEYYY